MATVTSKTSIKIDELVNGTIVSGYISPTGRLILVNRGGAEQDAGQVVTTKIQARWNYTLTYAANDVVGYAGSLWKAKTSTVAAGIAPALNSVSWDKLYGVDAKAWADLDPTFEMSTATASLNTFWANGTSAVSLSSAAGEFETGRQALKIVMGGASSQRLYSHEENVVTGGEYIQVKVRAKVLSGAGSTTIGANLWQNDTAGIPEVFAPGATQVVSIEPASVLTTTWTTYTFTCIAANAKPRAKMNLIFAIAGATGGTVLVDSIKIQRVDKQVPDGVWIDATTTLNMPNVFKSVGYARYMIVGKTLTYQAGIVIIAGGVIGQWLIDLPAGLDWGPGTPYVLSIGWADQAPLIGKMRAIRSGVSWYEGDIVPYSMKGANAARASVWGVGTAGTGAGSSSGAVWTGTFPATWQVGDRMSFTFTAEIA